MQDYSPGGVYVGLRCLAPVKRPGHRARRLSMVVVTWVSEDGFVVQAETTRGHRTISGSFAVCRLVRPGSGGAVVV